MRPASESCGLDWRIMGTVQARINDSIFVRTDATIIPAGTLLDATYRWMYDSRVKVDSFVGHMHRLLHSDCRIQLHTLIGERGLWATRSFVRFIA